MANVGDSFEPGARVPDSGIYACTKCGTHRQHFYSTDVKGHRFPPSHHPGAKWKLVEKTPHPK